MRILLLLIALARADAPAPDRSAFPLRADVSVPAEGVATVVLPADAVGTDPASLDRTLALVNAAGASVPYAVVVAPSSEPRTRELTLRATLDGTYTIAELNEPIDALRLGLPDAERPVRVAVSGPGVDVTTAIWRRPQDELAPAVRIPAARGPFTLTVASLDGASAPIVASATGFLSTPGAAMIDENVPVGEPVRTEQGRSRWVLRLPGPRNVVAVVLDVEGDVFDREVWIAGGSDGEGLVGPDTLTYASASGRVRRVRIGDTRVDDTRIDDLDVDDDTLVLEVADDRGAALPLRSVTIVSAGATLVTRDAGPGPHVLYVGGPLAADRYDLATATASLLDGAVAAGTAAAVAANPQYVPVATREGLDGPGSEVELSRWTFARRIAGGPGWSSVTLDAGVLARARPDGADLRVVDGEGRRIPFLLRRDAGEAPLALGPVRREEEGSASLLHVSVPDPSAPIATIRLHTTATTFARDVSVLLDRGGLDETVRHVAWASADHGGTLVLRVGQPVGAELVVRIDNGDDPPLLIDAVEASSPVWELRANLPPDARLLYGNPRADAPDHDLALLRSDMLRARVSAATLGKETRVAPPARSAADTAATLAGVGLLALGLVGMTVRVLRTRPGASEVEEPAAEG